MPTLEVEGKIYCQSSAIARFVARELGFYGNNAMDQLMIDQLCETVLEMFMAMSSIRYEFVDPDVQVSNFTHSSQVSNFTFFSSK